MSNNKQQTVVEWFKKELEDYGSNSHLSLDWNTFDELCQQAKEMHRQEIVNAVDGFPLENRNLNGTEYYEQTYGGNKWKN